MNVIIPEMLVTVILLSFSVFIFSLLFSVLIINSKSPQIFKQLNKNLDSSNWPILRSGKYDPGRLGLGFIFYFVTVSASKFKGVNNSLFILNLLAKLTLVLSILLIVINLFFYST